MLAAKFCILLMILSVAKLHVNSQPIQDSTIHYDDEDGTEQIKLYLERLKHVLKRIEPKFEKDLIKEIDYMNILLQTEPKSRLKLMEQSQKEYALSQEFDKYLQEQFDSDFINEEIRIEIYYLSKLKPLVGEIVSAEITNIVGKYEFLLNEPNIDKKYDDFTSVRDMYSEELGGIIDGQPETELALNVQLEYTLLFVDNLLSLHEQGVKEIGQFHAEIMQLKNDIVAALKSSNLDEKHKPLNSFDETKFGKFLSWKSEAFWLQKFGG